MVSGGLAAGTVCLLPVKEVWEHETLLFMFWLMFFCAAVAWAVTLKRVVGKLADDGWKKSVLAVVERAAVFNLALYGSYRGRGVYGDIILIFFLFELFLRACAASFFCIQLH